MRQHVQRLDKPSNLQLRQNVEPDKLAAFHRHLNIKGDPDLVDADRFKLKKKKKNQRQATYIYFSLMVRTGNYLLTNKLVNA